jgi:hypothetical protein
MISTGPGMEMNFKKWLMPGPDTERIGFLNQGRKNEVISSRVATHCSLFRISKDIRFSFPFMVDSEICQVFLGARNLL